MSLTLPTVYAFTFSKLLIALRGFRRLGAAFHIETTRECTLSQVYDVCHEWYVVPQCRPLDSRRLKCSLQLVHQQKDIPLRWNGTIRVDVLSQSRQRHPVGGLLRARRQSSTSHSISPSYHCVTISSHSVGLIFQMLTRAL